MPDLSKLQSTLMANLPAGKPMPVIDLINFDNPHITGLGHGGGRLIIVFGPEAKDMERFQVIFNVGQIANSNFSGEKTEGYEIAIGQLPEGEAAGDVMKEILGVLRKTTETPIGLTEDEVKRAYEFFGLNPLLGKTDAKPLGVNLS